MKNQYSYGVWTHVFAEGKRITSDDFFEDFNLDNSVLSRRAAYVFFDKILNDLRKFVTSDECKKHVKHNQLESLSFTTTLMLVVKNPQTTHTAEKHLKLKVVEVSYQNCERNFPNECGENGILMDQIIGIQHN